MRVVSLLLLLPLAVAELKDVVVSGKINLLHYVAKELASPIKEKSKVTENGLVKACKMEPERFFSDILFYVFECHSDVKSIKVDLPGSNNYLDGYQVETFDVQMAHTESPQLKHVTSCPVGVNDPTDMSCSTYVLDFFRAAPDIATLESMGMSSKRVIVVEPGFNSGTSSYTTTVEIDTPFSISARTLQPRGRAGILAPEGSGLDPALNGCDKAEQAQAVWEFPGFKTTGLFKFGVCAVAPDNIHETWYNVQVNVTRHYSTRLRMLGIVGKELDPPFDPEVQQYTVHVDGKVKEVDLKLVAVDSEASIRVDADKTTHGSDTMLTTVKMHDNDHLEVGEPPQWSRSVSVQLESADGEKTLTYLVHVKQKVSNYSYLANLSMDNTSCKMNPPKFEVNVTEYSCVFWWTETESPRVIPTMDKEKCPDCTLLIPSAREFPESHLSLQYQTQIKRVHESEDVWTRPFLYGEYHRVPFQVLSADKFTHTTYHVHLERDAPWWMKAATTRTISSWATVLATSMAIFSASNFVALTRMIQFMDLTTEIKGTPDVYNEFANHLKGFNFDPAPYLPDLGLPSMEDVRDMRNKAVQQLKDAFSVGDMKKSGTLVLQYCYALDVEGQLAANGILHTHPEGTKLLLQSLAEASDMFKATPDEDEEVEKRKLVLNDTKTRTVFGAQGTNTTLRSLRGVRKYAGDVSGDVTKLRSLEAVSLTSRRLDGDDDKEEKEKSKVKGPDSAMLVVQWTKRQWNEFIEKIKAENVTEADYPNAREKIPCNEHPMSDVVPFLFIMHELELVRRMMHTYTGTFILMFIVIFCTGAAYITYYRTVMMKSQRRVKWLEPGFLSIFVLDCGLIGFTKSAAKIISQPTLVTFFFWTPERWEVQAFVLAGIILYPVVFVILTYLMVSEVTKPSDELEEEEEEGEEIKKSDEKALKTKMVFNEDVEQWIDPTAREIKVTLEPPIPSWIPVLGEMITSHVRSCIPVLTVDGDPISFRTDNGLEEVKKAKPVVNKEKLQEEAAELEKKLNEELAQNATDATIEKRTDRAATIKKEQELAKKIVERAQTHLTTVKSIKEKMGQLQEEYCKEVTPGEMGPSGEPTWFPATPPKPKEGEEEEEEVFIFEKRSIFDLLTEWTSVKGREENEVLDAEESFAIRSYIEGHIRREKRLTKYNIMQVGTYKGYMLPKEPFNIVKKKDPSGETEKMLSVRERAEPSPHWWLPQEFIEKINAGEDPSTVTIKGKDVEYQLDEFGPPPPPNVDAPPPPPPYIHNSQGQRLIYESGQMGPMWRFLGRLKVGGQEAGVVRWMDEPEDGWEVFEKSDEEKQTGKGSKYANMVYADKWQWIYLDKWDLPWSGDDEEEKQLHFFGCWSVAKDDIPLFRIMEKALLKRFKTYVPKKIRDEEKNEIRQWMWKGLLGFTELKLKLGWMAKQHPKYKIPEISEIVTKPFDVFLLELAHATADKDLTLPSERAGDKSEELLNFTLMKFEDLFPDDEEPWWEESDKPADNERKVMFDHDVFFQDSGGDENENVEFKNRWKENKLIPEHGYYSSSCFTRFPEDTFGKKRYIVKKPDDPVESIARVEINVRLKHVLPLMRYTSHFKACVPINSLELPLRSNLQIILKESGNGEQFNYTVDRLTNLISIGVLASQPPGPVCAITLLLLQMVNFANRFYTNKESAKAVAKLMDEEEAREEQAGAAEASEKEPLTGGDGATSGKKKKLSPMKERIRKKREAMKNKTLMDSFLEVEVFKMFLQSLVLFLLCAGQFGWMPGPICALMCILVCVFTMIFMNVSTFRKEMNKQIESISNSVTEFYRMYRGYENAVMAWLSGENMFGWKFFNFEGAHASNLENISDVNFVVPELGLRLTGKTVVDDLLPQDEKIKQQLLKYTAYFANTRADSRAKVKAASDLQRYHQDIAPSFTLALSVDQLKLCQAIPPIAATIQCVNHAGSSISSPDFDSYYTLYYPEAWEDEHDQDKAAVQTLTDAWKEEVKTWMDESLGATYSDRTYTKKIQEHIAALMGMPFESSRSRHCVMIKLEQTLIPDFVPLRTSCREKIYKEMEDKMLFVTVLYEDEDFTVDMAYNRTSPLGRIVKMTDDMKDKLMYEGRRPEETPKAAKAEADGDDSPEPPAMMKTKSHFSIRPDMGKLKRFVAFLAEEGEEPPIFPDRESLEQFAFICEHEACEFKVPIPATVSKFKLMVWFQNNENGQPTEELVGFSEPFDLILPDEAALMGEDQADQKRVPFYTSWHTTLTQGLKIIQADDPVEEAKTWFGRLKNQVREYLAPPITKTHMKHSTGFVDMSVRNLTKEELELDKEQVEAMKDVTVGNSEINKQKLKRHLDRRGILSTFFGLRMEDACIESSSSEETLKAHLVKLEAFHKTEQSGMGTETKEKLDSGRQARLEGLLLEKDIRRTLWKQDAMEKAIESIKQAIKDYEETKKKEEEAKISIYPRYRIAHRYRGPRRVDQEVLDFDAAILVELRNFKKDQARMGKSILHYVMVADHLKHNKFWSPDAISPHVCGIIVNNTPDVPSVRLQCHKFNQLAAGEKVSKDMVFKRETLGSSKELPAFVNGRLCFKATDEEAEKYYKAFVPESPETWKAAKKGTTSEEREWLPVYLYWDGFARWVVSPFRGEPAPIRNLVPALEKARAYRGRGGEVIRQAACRLLGRIADTTWTFKDATAARYLQTLDECARHTTESIQVAAAEALKVLAAKRFKEDLVMKCVDNYLQGLQKSDETIAARRGFALSLGALGARNLQMRRQEVLQALRREALGEQLPGGKDQDDPTTRQYAVLSLGCLCIGVDLSSSEVSIFLSALEGAMQDYATDRRGDVGSWVREVAMEVLAALLQQQRLAGLPRLADAETSTKLMALLLQQGVEKIDRLRERAYGLLRMLCHGHTDGMHYAYRRVLHGEAYDAVSLASAVGQVASEASSTWPPAEIEFISKCLETSRIETTPMAEPTKADLQADRNAAVFDALAPLIGTATYRSALLKGIVVSVGGITEHTAKDAKRALLRQVFHSDAARHEVCSELLLFFAAINVKDSDNEAKRFLAPLLNTLGILMAQDAVPPEFARKMLQCTVAAVQLSRDVTRLRSSINVFVGLMRWLEVRREALEMLLQFLGYSFPTVRQATAQALYIRFLEEEGDLDLSKAPEASHLVSSEDLHSISELLSLTPWATDETETLQVALKSIYEKLKLELPQGGRSILVPKKVAGGEQRREAQYADLVRENHF